MSMGVRQKMVNNHLFMQEITRMFSEEGKKSVTFICKFFCNLTAFFCIIYIRFSRGVITEC